jgi:integrase
MRKLIAGLKFDVSPDTAKQYESAYARMTKLKKRPDEIASTKSSHYFYRAAFVFTIAKRARDVLRTADAAAKSGNDLAWEIETAKLDWCIKELRRFPPDPDKKMLSKPLKQGERKVFPECNLSKRRSITKLPPGWQNEIFDLASPSYKAVVAVLSLTGARPVEIANGVEIEIVGGELLATLRGAKTHGGKYGQEMRTLRLSTDTPMAQFLQGEVADAGGHLTVKQGANAVSQQLSRLGRLAFPKHRPSVSAYSFRHQVSADLKRSGLSGLDVSAALGHCVDETKRHYGSAHAAKGNSPIVAVTASREVRQKTAETVEVRLSKRSEQLTHNQQI